MSKSMSLFSALFCTFIWGTTFIAQDTGMDKIGPLTFNATRFFVGFLSIIPFALLIEKKEFYGGSMTITSLGGIGGSFFTPIINYPEVSILGVGRSYNKQVLINNEFKNRIVLPLSLSYDHRIIDGAEAARFCNELKENLGKNFAYKLAV